MDVRTTRNSLVGDHVKASRKKSSFLSGHRNLFPYIKKVLFSLVAHPFSPPPLLVAWPLRKDFFAASLSNFRKTLCLSRHNSLFWSYENTISFHFMAGPLRKELFLRLPKACIWRLSFLLSEPIGSPKTNYSYLIFQHYLKRGICWIQS